MNDQAAMNAPMGTRAPSPETPQAGGQDAASAMGQAEDKATKAVDATKEKVGQITDQVSPKADAGIDKAAGGLDKAVGMLRDKSDQMSGEGGGVQSVATRAADTLDVASGYLKDKDSGQIVADLEALVRRKPVESVLVALGVGFLLSKATR